MCSWHLHVVKFFKSALNSVSAKQMFLARSFTFYFSFLSSPFLLPSKRMPRLAPYRLRYF